MGVGSSGHAGRCRLPLRRANKKQKKTAKYKIQKNRACLVLTKVFAAAASMFFVAEVWQQRLRSLVQAAVAQAAAQTDTLKCSTLCGRLSVLIISVDEGTSVL
jgi:hypothetical protein